MFMTFDARAMVNMENMEAEIAKLREIILHGLQLSGGWREAIVELEDHCSEPVRLKNMLAAADGLDAWRKEAYAAFPQPSRDRDNA